MKLFGADKLFFLLKSLKAQFVSCAAMLSEVIMRGKICMLLQGNFPHTFAKCSSHSLRIFPSDHVTIVRHNPEFLTIPFLLSA